MEMSAYDEHPTCEHADPPPVSSASPRALERAARIFRALGDEARLRTLELLARREACVSEIADASGEAVSTVSHRLRLLRAEGLVSRRRDGRHIYYGLADHHVIELLRNALEHAEEDHSTGAPS
ncbi:MAG: metalloregulator ArsR/SmtB family transcription factor [Myxococcota bacterium]